MLEYDSKLKIFRKRCSNTIVNCKFSEKDDSKLKIFMGNCSSSMDESQKTPKIIRYPWMKMKKRWKLLVIHGWKRKNDEKRSLSVDENEKTVKIGFRPWTRLWPKGAKLNGFSNYLTIRFHADCKGLCSKATSIKCSHSSSCSRLQRPLLQSYLFPYISFMMALPTLAR